jgi:SAM-dependent methyltransferase
MPERPSEKYYRDTAKFYDPFATRPDEPFYKEMAKRYGSPILEMGSGTGRISLLLAEERHEIVGLELSPEMLQIAKEKLSKLPSEVRSRVTLILGDITDFDLDKTFKMVIVPSSFKFLLTRDEQLDCFKYAKNHLDDDGVFILDLYPGEVLEEEESFTTDPYEIDGAMVTKYYEYSNNLENRVRHWKVVIEISHPSEDVEQIETESITSLMTSQEADELLDEAGFVITEEYGDWEFGQYTSESWRRILILRKR